MRACRLFDLGPAAVPLLLQWFMPAPIHPCADSPPALVEPAPHAGVSNINFDMSASWGNVLDYIHYNLLPPNITDFDDWPNTDFYRLPAKISYSGDTLGISGGYYGRVHAVRACDLQPFIAELDASGHLQLQEHLDGWHLVFGGVSGNASIGDESDTDCTLVDILGDILLPLKPIANAAVPTIADLVIRKKYDALVSRISGDGVSVPVDDLFYNIENKIQESVSSRGYCLDLHPQGLGISRLTGYRSNFVGAGSVQAMPMITVGFPQCAAVSRPAIHQIPVASGAPFSIAGKALVSYEMLNSHMEAVLLHKTFNLFGPDVTVDGVSTAGENGWLVVKLRVSGKLEGDLVAWMVPEVDPQTQTIKIGRFQLSPCTQSALNSYDPVWGQLVASSLKQFVDGFTYSVAGRLRDLADKVSQPYAIQGGKVSILVGGFSADALYASSDGLEVIGSATGSASVEIQTPLSAPEPVLYPGAFVWENTCYGGGGYKNFEIARTRENDPAGQMSTFYKRNKGVISSIQTFLAADQWIVFYDQENMTGRELWIRGTQNVCNLVAIPLPDDSDSSWNDRIMSVQFSRTPPIGSPIQTILASQTNLGCGTCPPPPPAPWLR